MRVRMMVEVSDVDRYVISKYYGDRRARATRDMVRKFVVGAVASAVREQGDDLGRRQRRTVQRLADPVQAKEPPCPLREPSEKQLSLLRSRR